MWNVETPYPRRKFQAGETARHTDGGAGVRCRKKRMPSCNEADTDWDESIDYQHYPARKGADVRRVWLQTHPGRCFFERESGESLRMGKQMTAIAGAPINRFILLKRLQMRIEKVVFKVHGIHNLRHVSKGCIFFWLGKKNKIFRVSAQGSMLWNNCKFHYC